MGIFFIFMGILLIGTLPLILYTEGNSSPVKRKSDGWTGFSYKRADLYPVVRGLVR